MRTLLGTIGGLIALGLLWGSCSSDDAAPSPREVQEMTCAELEQAWQSHRRGEWDAPGTFNLLTDQIQQRC